MDHDQTQPEVTNVSRRHALRTLGGVAVGGLVGSVAGAAQSVSAASGSVAGDVRLSSIITSSQVTLTETPISYSESGSWLIFDPYVTTRCEIRRVQDITGTTITLASPLARTHTTGASGATVLWADELIFNVALYGAKVDGSADAQSAIQAAVNDAILAGGGTILFPSGTYSLGSSISIQGGQNLNFIGDGDVSIVGTAAIVAFFFQDIQSPLTHCQNILIKSLNFSNTGSGGGGVRLANTSQATIRDCSFTNLTKGIQIMHDTTPVVSGTDISVTANTITKASGGLNVFAVGQAVLINGSGPNNGHGSVIDTVTSTTLTVKGSQFTAQSAGSSLTLLRGTPCNDIIVTNCRFDTCTSFGIENYPKAPSWRHSITDNIFTNCGQTGGNLGAMQTPQLVDNALVKGNLIDGCENGLLIDNWNTLVITDNQIINCDICAMLLTTSMHGDGIATWQDIVISNNVCAFAGFSSPSPTLAYAISIEGTQATQGRITISDNVIDTWANGFRTKLSAAAKNIHIRRNTVKDCMFFSIDAGTTRSDGLLVEYNTFINTTTTSYYATIYSPNGIISHNLFRGSGSSSNALKVAGDKTHIDGNHFYDQNSNAPISIDEAGTFTVTGNILYSVASGGSNPTSFVTKVTGTIINTDGENTVYTSSINFLNTGTATLLTSY